MIGGVPWSAKVREIGVAFLALLRAEAEALAGDLGRSGRSLLRVLVLAATAGAFLFWTLGLLLYLAIELLVLVVPRWGAVAIVFALFALIGGGLILVARRRFAAVESPADTVRRRIEDNRLWWQQRIGGESEDEPIPQAPVDEELP